jgi:hypothetical protein
MDDLETLARLGTAQLLALGWPVQTASRTNTGTLREAHKAR